MKIKSNTTTYEFDKDEIKKLIAEDLSVDPNKVEVRYIIEEVDGDPLDRYPGVKTVTKIEVTVHNN